MKVESEEFKIYYIKDELHSLGKVQLATPMGNKVWAYDIDRTICDIVRSCSRMADETFITSIKNYATSPNKNLPAQVILQNYMFERFQHRSSFS